MKNFLKDQKGNLLVIVLCLAISFAIMHPGPAWPNIPFSGTIFRALTTAMLFIVFKSVYTGFRLKKEK